MQRILVADGDYTLCNRVARALNEAQYQVVVVHSADEVFTRFENTAPDLVLLDLLLPGADGLELCRKLRNLPQSTQMPILLLTNQGGKYSVTEALDAGGDDYIRKPFAVKELLARIRANLRWVKIPSTPRPQIHIFPDTYQVFINSDEISLTRVEFRLLAYMCQNPDSWHSTQNLLERVWHYPDGVGDSALVRNHVRNLRSKIEDSPTHPNIIQSRHGRGYTVQAVVQFEQSVKFSRR